MFINDQRLWCNINNCIVIAVYVGFSFVCYLLLSVVIVVGRTAAVRRYNNISMCLHVQISRAQKKRIIMLLSSIIDYLISGTMQNNYAVIELYQKSLQMSHIIHFKRNCARQIFLWFFPFYILILFDGCYDLTIYENSCIYS